MKQGSLSLHVVMARCLTTCMLAFVAACASQSARLPGASATAVDRIDVWITTSDGTQALTRAPGATFSLSQPRGQTITVEPARRFQDIIGFGAAITDSSAWLIQHRLDAGQRATLLQELFGRESGIGLSFTRLTIGASDFSRSHYSLDDMPAGQRDPQLDRFSIAPNLADVVPVTRAALAVNPQLKVMASPWSAPAWMKTSGSLIKGTLRKDAYDAFARYLLAYVDAYRAEGIPIFALTLQNEPSFEPEDYPGMRLQASQRAQLIAAHLGPMLERRGHSPLILEWDHNWDKPEEPMRVLSDPAAARHVAGVAWHCYGGDVAAQTQVHDAFPDKDVYMTECSGGDWEPVRSGGLTLQARQLIIGATRHWARGVVLWNLALDENGGPHAGGCDTCRGVVTIRSADGGIVRNPEYYALAHASRFVRPGARRIASSPGQDGIDNVAFRNADDGSIVLVMTNSADATRVFSVAVDGRVFGYELPERSLATFVWQGQAGQADAAE